jgi:hypothetical protein
MGKKTVYIIQLTGSEGGNTFTGALVSSGEVIEDCKGEGEEYACILKSGPVLLLGYAPVCPMTSAIPYYGYQFVTDDGTDGCWNEFNSVYHSIVVAARSAADVTAIDELFGRMAVNLGLMKSEESYQVPWIETERKLPVWIEVTRQ